MTGHDHEKDQLIKGADVKNEGAEVPLYLAVAAPPRAALLVTLMERDALVPLALVLAVALMLLLAMPLDSPAAVASCGGTSSGTASARIDDDLLGSRGGKARVGVAVALILTLA